MSCVFLNYFTTVPGRNACEIKMFHQEDAGLNVNIAKLAFAKGIWSYVCNMDNALLKYSAVSHPHSAVTAVTLIQKVCTISFRILLCALFFRDLFQVLFYLSFRTRMFWGNCAMLNWPENWFRWRCYWIYDHFRVMIYGIQRQLMRVAVPFFIVMLLSWLLYN